MKPTIYLLTTSGKNPGLASAAKTLIKAAGLEADVDTQKQLVANIEALRTSIDSNLNKVVQKIDSSNMNFDALEQSYSKD